MKYFKVILLILLPVTVFCQQPVAVHYKIYDSRVRKLVSINNIVKEMNNADVLFFGEEHNDSTGHALELMIFEQMAEKYRQKTALSMEMFETDCQNVLDEYLQGLIREKNFTTDARTWPNYKDYRPLIEFAKSNLLPVIAANAPSRYISMVNRSGLASLKRLNAIGRSYLPPDPIDTATGPYYQKFLTIMGGHAGMAGMNMYQAQSLWDATMAWSVSRFLKAHPGFKVLQLNGGFHSEQKLGAAEQLLRYMPMAKILNIAVYSDDNYDNPDWGKFSQLGDYVILTDPKVAKTF